MSPDAFNLVTSDILEQIAHIVGKDNLSTSQAERDLRSRDMSGHPAHLSEVVVWPTSAQQTADVLKIANEHRVPVTPWGVGTSLEGNPIPLYGGILLSTERMANIVKVHADDFQVTVQPGIGYKDLNDKLARHALFFPPDPGANATIGGMLANNAAGIRTVKYGASKDNVLRMQVALADGRLINVGSRSIKQSSGYDLLHLFVGSEGTLGVITEATLKLAPVPTLVSAVVASFDSVALAVETVVAIRGSGLDPAALEFIDARSIATMNAEEGLGLGEYPTLFMEFDAAHQTTLEKGIEAVVEICNEMGAHNVRSTTDAAERKKLWHARYAAFEIAVRLHPGARWVILDVAVPISVYPEIVTYVERTLDEHNTMGYLIGHAGDGNIHAAIPCADDAMYEQSKAVNEAIVLKAIDLGGTATGEHGVGVGKARYMRHEHGLALDVMQSIKQTLDPNGIMNPGKIFQN